MNGENEGFVLDSKEELDQKSGSKPPLEAEDYIIKLAKIDLVQKPAYVNGQWDYRQLNWMFECICIVQGLKAGGEMKDVNGGDVPPFSRYLYREVNPRSLGFQSDKVTPSFLRGLVSYMEECSVNDNLKIPGIILLDKSKQVIRDQETINNFLAEFKKNAKMYGSLTDCIKNQNPVAGYYILPDIRSYEGRYVGCAIEAEVKGERKMNKITKFSKLPSVFVKPSQQEEVDALTPFKEYYLKIVVPRRKDRLDKGVSGGVNNMSSDDLGEVKIDEISF